MVFEKYTLWMAASGQLLLNAEATEISLLISASLLIAYILAHLINTARLRNCPQSTASIFVGVLVGLYLWFRQSDDQKTNGYLQAFNFNPRFFYFFMLPPIVLEAGFSLDRPNFLNNIGMILWLAVVGTFVSAISVAAGLYLLAPDVGLQGSKIEVMGYCCLFGSLLAAVDPVATLSILGCSRIQADERLFALVFGESILNDSVAVVLFQTVERLLLRATSNPKLTESIPMLFLELCAAFLKMSLFSVMIGCATGIMAYAAFKLSSGIRKFPEYELGTLLLLAYFSFALAETLHTSGILSLFVTGILLGHYNMRNLSPTSQRSSALLFKVIAVLSESFIYVLFGVVAVESIRTAQRYPWRLILITLVLILISRAVSIFPSTAVLNAITRRRAKRRLLLSAQQTYARASLRALLLKQMTLFASKDSSSTPIARSNRLLGSHPMEQHGPIHLEALSCDKQEHTPKARTLKVVIQEAQSFYSRQSTWNIVDPPQSEEAVSVKSMEGLFMVETPSSAIKSNEAESSPKRQLHHSREDHALSMSSQLILWLSGLRGAIAFVLALSLPNLGSSTSLPNRDVLITATLAIAILTTVVLGGSIEAIAIRIGIAKPAHRDDLESGSDARLLENNDN